MTSMGSCNICNKVSFVYDYDLSAWFCQDHNPGADGEPRKQKGLNRAQRRQRMRDIANKQKRDRKRG